MYLSECHQIQALEDKDRQDLNFPQLEVLHIARCDNLERLKINGHKLQILKADNNVNLKDLEIAELCPNLKELYLSECSKIQALEDKDRQDLDFPQLEVLHIDKCDNLERLKINAPKLRVLQANNDVKLKDFNISGHNSDLKEMYLSGCHQIQALEDKDRQDLNFPQLEILHIDKCDNLERLKINAPKLRVLQANNDVKLKDLNISEHDSDLKELYLSECHQIQALEDRDSKDLNFPQLEVLHIDKCDNLERLKINAPKLRVLQANNDVKLKDLNISEHDSDLKELYLSECHQIQALEDKDSQDLNFPNLEVLHIDGCDNLERLKINAPKLRVLQANNDVKLKDLNISESFSELREMYLGRCQIQALEDRDSKDLNFPQLEVLHIDKCDNLEILKINAPKLRVLEASYNVKLKDLNISESFSDLKEVYLSGCYQIQALDDKDSKNLNFPNLEVLHIDGCDNLEILKIDAPKLQVLRANNDVNFKELNIAELCPNLKKLTLSKSHQIQALKDKDSKDLNFPNLEVLHIDECDNLERLKINAPKLLALEADNVKLKELSLSDCHQIQALEDGRRHRQPLNFPDLDVLHISRCDSLERLHIHVPKLRVLKADNNAKLKEIILTYPLVELNIDNCPLVTEIVFRNKAFGKKEWEKYFGDIGLEPPLPANIEKILNEPCSFWPDKKVKETHLLVLIPNTVNGNPFTMNYLEELINKPKSGHSTKAYRSYNRRIPLGRVKEIDESYSSHWVLMTRDVIPGSRHKCYQDCCNMIANHSKETGLHYELPNLLEATASILTHYVKTGERLYSNDPWTLTYIRESMKYGWLLVVGDFAPDGLVVTFDLGNLYICQGVAGCRRF